MSDFAQCELSRSILNALKVAVQAACGGSFCHAPNPDNVTFINPPWLVGFEKPFKRRMPHSQTVLSLPWGWAARGGAQPCHSLHLVCMRSGPGVQLWHPNLPGCQRF